MSGDISRDADYPGLQDEEDNDSYDEDSDEERDFLKVKKKDKHKKDKGYKTMAAEMLEDDDERSKAKKSKGLFRRGLAKTKEKEKEKDSKTKKKDDSKAEKREKHMKTERKERETKVEKKDKDKESKAEKKEKEKSRKKSAHNLEQMDDGTRQEKGKPRCVFGVPLAVAVENSKLYDGIELPAVVRDCIDYVESHALNVQGIYRISGVKSQVTQLRQQYERKLPINLEEYDPHAIAGLLKQFLREIPEPVLTTQLMPRFEEAATLPDDNAKIEAFQKLISELPVCNRTLLTWVFVHMSHVIEKESENKMSLQNVAIVLSPTMHLNHKVLSLLFKYRKTFFKDVTLKRPTKPLRWQSSRTSLELPPDTSVSLEEELSRQEAILAKLHEDMNKGIGDQETEEKLWEVQRIVTTLKRKIRQSKKQQAAKETEKIQETEEKVKEKEKEGEKEEIQEREAHKEETVPEKAEEQKVEEADKKENEEVQVTESVSDDESVNDLLKTEAMLVAEEQELMSLKNELIKRLENERNEVERLKSEISQIRDERRQSPSNTEDSSSSNASSDSESEDEEQLQNILDDLLHENEELEAKNDELSIAIHEERAICIHLKVQVQLAQSCHTEIRSEDVKMHPEIKPVETAETAV